MTINVPKYCVWDFYGIYFCPPGQAHLFIVQYLNNRIHGENLSSTPDQADPFAKLFIGNF